MAFSDSRESDTLAAVHFPMADHAEDSKILLGRELGQRVRSSLEREIDTHRFTEEPVAIDFAGVRGMTVPFADAFFVPLLSGRLQGYYEEHPVLVINATDDVYETLEAVLVKRNLAVLAVERDRGGALLGGEPALRETMRAAAELAEFTANELADKLGLTVQATNNRLKQLLQIGALVRTALVPPGGGREYRYRVPEADNSATDAAS
jgi:hypothetical protein